MRRREFEAVEWDRILRRGRKGSGDLPGLQSRRFGPSRVEWWIRLPHASAKNYFLVFLMTFIKLYHFCTIDSKGRRLKPPYLLWMNHRQWHKVGAESCVPVASRARRKSSRCRSSWSISRTMCCLKLFSSDSLFGKPILLWWSRHKMLMDGEMGRRSQRLLQLR